MLFGVDIDNLITGIMGIIGIILSIEKIYKWIKNKFDYAHTKVNEADDIKEKISQHVDEIKKLQEQNKIILEGIKNLLRSQLKHDCLKYVQRKSITQEELEEYEDTYKIYTSIGGNGAGTKYHNDVINLPISDNN